MGVVNDVKTGIEAAKIIADVVIAITDRSKEKKREEEKRQQQEKEREMERRLRELENKLTKLEK